ncbi:MAG: hypothetical protein K0U93_28695 [Gammaproteobacteria bacterium]|nr:hypothetical protein [Gammaproteobacteria bacterium]
MKMRASATTTQRKASSVRSGRALPRHTSCLYIALLMMFGATDVIAEVTASDNPSVAVEVNTGAQPPAASVALMDARTLLQAGDAAAARVAFSALAQADDIDAQDALAAMWLEGIGGPQDRSTAMVWYCRLAHQPRGGRLVMRAVWFLAEYFRTGGGLPGRRYNDGTPALQNPLRAYFWYQVMARQAELYQITRDEALKVGRLGSASVERELTIEEQKQVAHDVRRWSSRGPEQAAKTCLNLFDGRQ